MDAALDLTGHMVAWIAVNLVVPYLLPLALIRLMQQWRAALTPAQYARLRLTYLVKEAQLGLVNVAVAALGIYELLPVPSFAAWPSVRYILFALFTLMLLVNTLLFVWGTVIGNPEVESAVLPGVGWNEWRQHYPMGAWSIIFGFVTAALATAAHFVVYSDEQAHRKSAQIHSPTQAGPAQTAGSEH